MIEIKPTETPVEIDHPYWIVSQVYVELADAFGNRVDAMPDASLFEVTVDGPDGPVKVGSWVTLTYRWATLSGGWVTLRARWVTLRARWVTLRARCVTLRAR
jgi:hypothetical protein